MNGPGFTYRRTILKTITATAVRGGVLTGTANTASTRSPDEARGRRNVVEVVARHNNDHDEHSFELHINEVTSGWTVFEFDIRTDHTHFVYSSKIPQQAIEDADDEEMDLLDFWIEPVTKPFQYFLDATFVPDKEPDPADNTDIYESLFPPSFGDVTYYGGPGLTSGLHSSKSTVELDSGEYIVQCYIKNSDRRSEYDWLLRHFRLQAIQKG